MGNGDGLQDADTRENPYIQAQERMKEQVRIREEYEKELLRRSHFAVESAEHDVVFITLAGAAFIHTKS